MLREKMHVAVPTAFDKDEKLNIDKTITHIKEVYSKGIKSVLVGGTTGEQHSLSVDEKLDILGVIESEKQLISEMEIIMGVSAVRQKDAEILASRVNHPYQLLCSVTHHILYLRSKKRSAIRIK